MKEKLLGMLKEINPYEDIDENTQLIEQGILDSLTLVILVNEIEIEYQITIPEENMAPNYFNSIIQIEKLLKELQAHEEEKR